MKVQLEQFRNVLSYPAAMPELSGPLVGSKANPWTGNGIGTPLQQNPFGQAGGGSLNSYWQAPAAPVAPVPQSLAPVPYVPPPMRSLAPKPIFSVPQRAF